jgi:hypothetical protein
MYQAPYATVFGSASGCPLTARSSKDTPAFSKTSRPESGRRYVGDPRPAAIRASIADRASALNPANSSSASSPSARSRASCPNAVGPARAVEGRGQFPVPVPHQGVDGQVSVVGGPPGVGRQATHVVEHPLTKPFERDGLVPAEQLPVALGQGDGHVQTSAVERLSHRHGPLGDWPSA